jgi:hypothetical protein
MKLLTSEQKAQMLKNGLAESKGDPTYTPTPVVKLFTPDAACTWLLAELDPEDPDIAFGLCDLGMGFPELGSVRMSELESVRGRLGLPVERDRSFSPTKTLLEYAREAQASERITA